MALYFLVVTIWLCSIFAVGFLAVKGFFFLLYKFSGGKLSFARWWMRWKI